MKKAGLRGKIIQIAQKNGFSTFKSRTFKKWKIGFQKWKILFFSIIFRGEERMLEKYDPRNPAEIIKAEMEQSGKTKTAALEDLRRKIPKESYFQKKIRDRLKKEYPDAFLAKIAQGQFSQGGIPDLMMILEGHYFAIEVKRPILGEPTALQRMTMEQIRKAGGTAIVASWPEQVTEEVERWKQQSRQM